VVGHLLNGLSLVLFEKGVQGKWGERCHHKTNQLKLGFLSMDSI
jgi:hypothetical protein